MFHSHSSSRTVGRLWGPLWVNPLGTPTHGWHTIFVPFVLHLKLEVKPRKTDHIVPVVKRWPNKYTFWSSWPINILSCPTFHYTTLLSSRGQDLAQKPCLTGSVVWTLLLPQQGGTGGNLLLRPVSLNSLKRFKHTHNSSPLTLTLSPNELCLRHRRNGKTHS